MTMTKRELDKPAFVIGLRGYDRQQVDDYIDRLRGIAAEAQERASAAEKRRDAAAAEVIRRARAAQANERERAAEVERRARMAKAELEASARATIGPRISQMFELAAEEAKELRAQAEAEGEQIRTSARREADDTREEARRELNEVGAEVERCRQQVADLKAEEEALVADVRRLQAALQTVADLIGNPPEALRDAGPQAGEESAGGEDAPESYSEPSREIVSVRDAVTQVGN